MTSEVDICNQALASIGTRSTIASLDENSNEAINCKLQYASTRDQLLRCAPWNFARRFETLGLLKAAPGTPELPVTTESAWSGIFPPPPWLYSYAYPSNCCFARYVIPQDVYASGTPIFPGAAYISNYTAAAVKFIVANEDDSDGNTIKTICTNVQGAVLCFTKFETNPDMFDSEFVIALINALAANIAIPLTGDKGIWDRCERATNGVIAEARQRDANEQLDIYDIMPDWIRIRGIAGPNFAGRGQTVTWGEMWA